MRFFCLFFLFMSVCGWSRDQVDIQSIEVLLAELDPAPLHALNVDAGYDAWMEVTYFAAPGGSLLHEELGERLWWIGDHPVVVLGGTGLPLPDAVLQRASIWIEIHYEGELVWAEKMHPRKASLRFTQDRDQVIEQFKKGGNLRYTASYLAEVANFMAGNSATVTVDADQYRLNTETIIDSRGINLDTTGVSAAWDAALGSRLQWAANRSALRAGELSNISLWTGTNLGSHSTGFGLNPLARGAYSFSAGNGTEATGDGSVAFGISTTASGGRAFAGGENADATGPHSLAYGSSVNATDDYAVAFGSGTAANGLGSLTAGVATTADAFYSVSMGFNTDATGTASFAMGHFSNAAGVYSSALGQSTVAGYAATALGRYNVDSGSTSTWVASDPLFTLGNGTSTLARHNAFEIDKDGFLQSRRDVDAAGTNPTHYVANFHNEETTQGGDVLALSVVPSNPNAASNFIAFFGNNTLVGEIDGNGGGGVSYKSSAADFAEWFPRVPGEAMEAGEVIALRDGQVSRRTDGASQAFVISTAPFLVGNDRGDQSEETHELVALTGQVPVKVTGVVQAGDWLVPSGNEDGLARAYQPTDGATAMIGIALTSPAGENNTVTALVGGQATHPALRALLLENRELRQTLASIQEDIESLKAGFSPAQKTEYASTKETEE